MGRIKAGLHRHSPNLRQRWTDMKLHRVLLIALVLLPLTVGAETVSWTPNTKWTGTDSTGATVTGTFTTAEMATMTYYVRANKYGVLPRVYIGEAKGVSTWVDNVLVRLNAGGVAVVAGDNVQITVSQAFKDTGGEQDSPESMPVSWVLPGKPIVLPPTNRGCTSGPTAPSVK
jgi:hypothetical protein